MKITFIGLGRMGQVMAQRILDAGFDLCVYDLMPQQCARFKDTDAKIADSIADALDGRDVVITMLPSDEALASLTETDGGLFQCMSQGMIHVAMGTHGVKVIQSITDEHHERGQLFVVATVLGRPELAATGKLTIIPAGPGDTLTDLNPLFEQLGSRISIAGEVPLSSTILKISHNFVLGCAIEAMGEGVSLVRKHGGDPALFHEILIKGLFGAPAYEVYGKIIVEEDYENIGATAVIGLKDANLALTAAEVAKMPLPSANVLRDRLLGAIAHGEGHLDWTIVARDQARASGLE